MKNKVLLLFLVLFYVNLSTPSMGQQRIEKWGIFETQLKATSKGNPFDETITATFKNGDTKITVGGFYDGNNTFRIRFMPTVEGKWTFTTSSSLQQLDGKSGTLLCVSPTGINHGPVVTDGEFDFMYADSTRYYPVGTTSYDWMHAVDRNGVRMQPQTIEALRVSRFNKIRQLLLPHHFDWSYPDPDLFPFVVKNVSTDDNGRKHYEWDYTRFNPAFFSRIESCVMDLMALGIEADMIMLHPYDEGRWGFDSMPVDVTIRYLEYATRRLAAYRNIWWSMANEYDLMREQKRENWDAYTDAVINQDPYHHLISIHSYTAQYYSYWDNRYTHCSIQDQAPVEDFGRAPIVRNIYRKPIVFDEVMYEGDMEERWGNMTGEEMLFRMYIGLMAGTYVGHSECYQFGDSHDFYRDFLAVGGPMQGEAWKRIGFMRDLLDDLPCPPYLADSSWDPHTTAAGTGYYLVYLGKEINNSWAFNLPTRNRYKGAQGIAEGDKFRVEVIDTWSMTITPCPTVFVAKKKDKYRTVDAELRSVRLPQLPYLMLRIKKVS